MSSNTTKQNLAPLKKAITSLDKLYPRVIDEKFMSQQDEVIRLGLEAGLIQNFEFTYELCWKDIKRWLENNISPDIADGVSRRELFRLAAENKLIDDIDEWMAYHAARNSTSHRYGKSIAKNVLQQIGDFIRAAQRLLGELQKRND
jgi:nucleotidyltransferase substrate binding protein (TIGR01987 family)